MSISKKSILLLITSLICLSAMKTASAVDEDIIYLRKDCSGIGSNQHCFTDIEDVETWLWTTRSPTPSASSPVTVHIGAGEFYGTFDCNNNGYVTLIGSGPASTKIIGSANAITGDNCEELGVQNMTITNSSGNYPLDWLHGGSSRWVNVDVIGFTAAWVDFKSSCDVNDHPIHYWFNSKITSLNVNSTVYNTSCGETWFYATELTKTTTNTFFDSGGIVSAIGDVNIHAFGSVLRANIAAGNEPYLVSTVTGVALYDDASFHMHGGIINLDLSAGTNINVIGIDNKGTGMVHTPDTAYSLKSGTGGSNTRILNTGTGAVHAPFQWPAATTAPAITSQLGSDTYIETDCTSAGDCSGNGSNLHPHMMVYDASCTINGSWFDMTINQCRQ